MLESKSVVVGGGCVEAALSIYLENFATSLSSREQLAIADFAKSLLVIPKVKLKIIDWWTFTLVKIQGTVCLISRTKLDSPIFCFVPFENYPTHPRVWKLWILKNIPFIFFDAVGWHLVGIVGHLLTNGQELMICDALINWLIHWLILQTLAVNAAKDASDLVAKLRAYHNSSQTKKVLSQHRDSVQSEN